MISRWTRAHGLLLLVTVGLIGCAGASPPESDPHEALPPVETTRDGPRLMDMDGQEHDVDRLLADGKLVTLVFWQTWCAPCLREAPGLGRAALEHKSSIRFFGIVTGSDDYVDDSKVRSVAQRFELPYPQIRDRDASLSNHYDVKGTPTIVVLDRHGIVFRGHRAPPNWNALATGT